MGKRHTERLSVHYPNPNPNQHCTKVDVLAFIRSTHREVEVWEIEQHFGYRGTRGVYMILNRLKRQGLVANPRRGLWQPTDKGLRRLRYEGRE